MTVAELIEKLKEMPQEAIVAFDNGYPEEVGVVEMGDAEREVRRTSSFECDDPYNFKAAPHVLLRGDP